mmetsp:Transcript_24915/g.76928  ORF Transcript_24915/g.76928 Transcript_24915/m.76928 type:complete len:223 (-) Transcript_24915:19-687(-)
MAQSPGGRRDGHGHQALVRERVEPPRHVPRAPRPAQRGRRGGGESHRTRPAQLPPTSSELFVRLPRPARHRRAGPRERHGAQVRSDGRGSAVALDLPVLHAPPTNATRFRRLRPNARVPRHSRPPPRTPRLVVRLDVRQWLRLVLRRRLRLLRRLRKLWRPRHVRRRRPHARGLEASANLRPSTLLRHEPHDVALARAELRRLARWLLWPRSRRLGPRLRWL